MIGAKSVSKENEINIIIELINLLNDKKNISQTLKSVIKFLLDWSACEAVAIRLKEGDDFPYFVSLGFTEEHLSLENSLCEINLKGELIKDEKGQIKYECICGHIISGQVDHSKTYFTSNGSFWTNCTSELISSGDVDKSSIKTRNRCVVEGYESIALIPLKTGNKIIGLIQLNDSKKNKFTLQFIELLEQFAVSIAIAVSKKMTFKALMKSEARYRKTLDNLLEGAQIIGFDWRYLYVNNTFVQQSRYSKQDLINHTVFDLYPEIKNSGLLKVFQRCFDERVSIRLENVMIRSRDYMTWFDLSFHPIPEGIFILSNEITNRKLAELELEKQNVKLQNMNRELEQFAYLTSHDLQEPLRTLTSFAELLQKEYNGKLKGEGEVYLDFILKSSDRMKILIKDLLDYSRIGKLKNVTNINCNELVKEVLIDIDFLINENNAKITIEDLPVITCDRTELRQLFQNLIINSIKFRKKGEVPLISISAVKLDDYWRFAIQDNGIGIDEIDKEKIFLLFKRLHNRKDYDGTGIGLSICKKIVEMNNGHIWVESKINEGSTFYFTMQ